MMNKIIIKKILLLAILFFGNVCFSQTLHLYAGDDHDIYLGCLNCSRYDTNSIWNPYGNYGNSYSDNSIWNQYGKYGNGYNATCPWNQYALKPPVVVDKDGGFYGYLAVNQYQDKRANFELAIILYKYYPEIRKDVGEWHDKIFK